MNPVPLVVDIYHGDNVESFITAYNAGLRGVIHKATTGATGHDDAYASRRQPATKAGLLWGAYHWGTNANVQAQVDNFMKWAKPDANTLVALDYEETSGNQMTLSQAREFLTLLEKELGRKPVIYAGHLLKSELGSKKDAFFGSHRLWLAQYGNTPQVQASWDTYWLWQYTDGVDGPNPKAVPGISGNSSGHLDCDHFPRSEADLAKEWAS